RDRVAGQADANSAADVFLFDRVGDTTVLVSHGSAGPASTANHASSSPVVSGDGSFVAYVSTATDVVAGQDDGNGFGGDVFLFTRAGGGNRLVSRSSAGSATTGNGASDGPSLSGDGAFLAFQSAATDLLAAQADGNNAA